METKCIDNDICGSVQKVTHTHTHTHTYAHASNANMRGNLKCCWHPFKLTTVSFLLLLLSCLLFSFFLSFSLSVSLSFSRFFLHSPFSLKHIFHFVLLCRQYSLKMCKRERKKKCVCVCVCVCIGVCSSRDVEVRVMLVMYKLSNYYSKLNYSCSAAGCAFKSHSGVTVWRRVFVCNILYVCMCVCLCFVCVFVCVSVQLLNVTRPNPCRCTLRQ